MEEKQEEEQHKHTSSVNNKVNKEASEVNKEVNKEPRRLVFKRNEKTNLYVVVFEGGGQVPKRFRNVSFSSSNYAKAAIDAYYAEE